MNILFVTGCNAAFFNSSLVGLQSFAERMPGHRLLVCDFGLTGPQAEFLRGLGVWLERPPILASRGVFHCKAGLLRYLRHGRHDIGNYDAVVWLDADLTLMTVGAGDFEAVIAAMTSAGADLAVCPEPAGRSLRQFVAETTAMEPFARMVADTGIDDGAPYLSSGLFCCRSAVLLERWEELTNTVATHPLFEQNMFNAAIHRNSIPFVPLDCEEWQAQGQSLDKVRLVPSDRGGRPGARIGAKNIKTLHATSSGQGHLLIAMCRMTVRDLLLTGTFKLFFAEPLRMHQLQLLAMFMTIHGETLMRLGVCTRSARPVEGFEFVTL
jgi:hypothetical protein